MRRSQIGVYLKPSSNLNSLPTIYFQLQINKIFSNPYSEIKELNLISHFMALKVKSFLETNAKVVLKADLQDYGLDWKI